jgi:hypothetical protein
MIRRYRMPFAIDNPKRPGVRVAKYGWRLLRPAGIGWIVIEHDDTHVTIETLAPVPAGLHTALSALPDVEVLA